MTEFKKGDKVLVKPGEVSRYGWAPKDYTTPLTVSYEQHDGYVAVLAGVLEYLFRPEQLTPAPDPSKFKKGDRVQKVAPHNAVRDGENDPNGPDDFAREAAMGALGTVTGTAATHLYIEWDNGKTSCVPREVVAPAPLDPKDVKPGDTVTLESVLEAPFKVTGVVEKIDITLFDADGLAVAFNVMIWSRWFTVGINLRLTTHQPAPEPEPEYAPGFYTVHPYDSPETNWTGFVDSEGTFYGEEDGFFRQAFKGDYTVDSRLVVIDPADVDVEALSDVYDKAYDDSSHTSFSEGADIKAGLRAVLNALGIEVPR
jgi:hypothetical protein